MAQMSFQDYCDDILDLHTGLMSADEMAEAMAGYREWMAPKEKTAKHPDAGLKLAELRAKVERFVTSQKIAIERNADKDLSLVKACVTQAEEVLAGKARKADLLALITLNSEASRHLNEQMR